MLRCGRHSTELIRVWCERSLMDQIVVQMRWHICESDDVRLCWADGGGGTLQHAMSNYKNDFQICETMAAAKSEKTTSQQGKPC